jgi:fructan beta-fructosidase
VAKQGPVMGYRGRYFMDSMHGGDGATGAAVSPPFVITGRRMTLRLSGGAGVSGLRVELRVAGRAVRTAHNAEPGERMSEHVWDVAELAGRDARLALIDEATGSWGHLNVDHVLLWQ